MRQPLRANAAQRQQISHIKSYPAPVGGLNTRDSLAAMDPRDAVTLDNLYPHGTYVELRGGSTDHATGMTGNGKTLAIYNGITGTNTMWCTTASGTYNVSSAGAVGASVAARTNGKHQWVNFGDGTSQWLIMCNGVDKPLYYDGAAWVAVDGASTPALTGITTTKLIAPMIFKGRLIFIEKDTLSFWYLASGTAGGALTEFDLSGVAQKGGYLMACASISIDAGDGPDDRFVAITSEGEIIIYVGTNPSVAANWALVGVFTVGKPLGRRCLTKYGADLVVITQNGVFPLSRAILSSIINYKTALSDKIQNIFNEDSISYGSTFGWEAIVYPAQTALVVNIPISEDGEHRQYVMNTLTNSWCRFLEWDAECFGVFNKDLYFCTGTKVVKAWTGTSDNGSNIESNGKHAFQYFNTPGQRKEFVMFRPVLAVNGPLQFLTGVDVDFEDRIVSGSATYSVTSGAQWDVSLWDVGMWAAGLEIRKEWTSPASYTGYCGAGKLKTASNALTIQWIASDMVIQMGDGI